MDVAEKWVLPADAAEAQGNLAAYAPDIDGCITTGQTVDEVLHNMQEALSLHLEGMLGDGDPIPPAAHIAADFVEVDV